MVLFHIIYLQYNMENLYKTKILRRLYVLQTLLKVCLKNLVKDCDFIKFLKVTNPQIFNSIQPNSKLWL